MSSLRLLSLAAALVAVIASSETDTTVRDFTERCNAQIVNVPHENICKAFAQCCKVIFDLLDGDRCKVLVENSCSISTMTSSCRFANCTQMSTAFSTTARPARG